MPELAAPTTEVHTSFLDAMAEFQKEGRGGPDDQTMVGDEIRDEGATWQDADAFAEYTARLRADALEETPRREGYVPCTTLWYVDGTEYLGRLGIDDVLITCDADNVGSRRVIEANGGRFADERGGKLRFWART